MESPSAKDDREPGASVFVAFAWAACAAGALGLAWTSAADTPIWDDWANVPVLTGERPVTAEWLWSQHNEHRIPLPRLILLGLSKVTGGSFRAPSLLNAGLLALASGALVLAVRRRRGWSSYADAFLPLLLCGPGHERNILIGFQIQLISSTVLYAIALAMVVHGPGGLGTPGSALMAAIVALLPLCGANGVAFVPALALAMFAQAWADRSRSPLRSSVLGIGAVVGLGLVVAYFRGWKPAGHSDVVAPVPERLRIALQFLSGGWGDAAARTWPWSGWVEATLLVGGLVALAVGWRRETEGRTRTFWMLAMAGAIGSLGLGIGWGRAGMGDFVGFEDRYVTLAAPSMATAYLAWCGVGGGTGRLAQMLMFALACAVTWPDAEAMLEASRQHRDSESGLAADIASGMPPSRLIPRHLGFLHNSHDDLEAGLALLKKHRLGLYANLADDPPFREVSLPVEPTSMIGMTGRSGRYRAVTVDPYLVYELPEPRLVTAVRLRYRHANARGLPGRFILLWKHDGGPPGRHPIWTLPTGEERTITVWTNDRISRLMIQPDNKPCDFEVHALTLLVPDEHR